MKTFFLFLLLCTLGGCKDDPKPKTELEKLPPATQTGKNTFGCLVNGKAWVTRTSIDAVAFYQEGLFQLGAQIQEKDRVQSISLAITNGIVENVQYDLSEDPIYEGTFSWVLESRICFYNGDNTVHGNLVITRLNESHGIVSGLFEFTTVTDECDTIKVTDGRFDLMYAN